MRSYASWLFVEQQLAVHVLRGPSSKGVSTYFTLHPVKSVFWSLHSTYSDFSKNSTNARNGIDGDDALTRYAALTERFGKIADGTADAPRSES